jgi:hypothetical protein
MADALDDGDDDELKDANYTAKQHLIRLKTNFSQKLT